MGRFALIDPMRKSTAHRSTRSFEDFKERLDLLLLAALRQPRPRRRERGVELLAELPLERGEHLLVEALALRDDLREVVLDRLELAPELLAVALGRLDRGDD